MPADEGKKTNFFIGKFVHHGRRILILSRFINADSPSQQE